MFRTGRLQPGLPFCRAVPPQLCRNWPALVRLCSMIATGGVILRGRGFSGGGDDDLPAAGRLDRPTYDDEEQLVKRTPRPQHRGNGDANGRGPSRRDSYDDRKGIADHLQDSEGGVKVSTARPATDSASSVSSETSSQGLYASKWAPPSPTSPKVSTNQTSPKSREPKAGFQLFVPSVRRISTSAGTKNPAQEPSSKEASQLSTHSHGSSISSIRATISQQKVRAAARSVGRSAGLDIDHMANPPNFQSLQSALVKDLPVNEQTSTTLPGADPEFPMTSSSPTSSSLPSGSTVYHTPKPPSRTSSNLNRYAIGKTHRAPKHTKGHRAPAPPSRGGGKATNMETLVDAMKRMPPRGESYKTTPSEPHTLPNSTERIVPRPIVRLPAPVNLEPNALRNPSPVKVSLGNNIPLRPPSPVMVRTASTPPPPPQISVKVNLTPSLEESSSSGVSLEATTEKHVYSTSTVSNTETYQLGDGEEYLSESSASSESATSTIGEYEVVSDEEILPKKKAAKSSNGVSYPIALDEEPYVPLSYQVPTDELVKLLSLNEGNKNKFWSHSLYRNGDKKITVECCTTLEACEAAAQKFLHEKAVGFDMEWLARPSKKVWDNVSLIQLAKEDHIALFHLGRIQKANVDQLLCPSLRNILESKSILKLGVAVAGDGGRLKKWLGIEVQGLMELSAIHHMNTYAQERRSGNIPKVLVSLTNLSKLYLQLPISKGFVRISDWTKPLTESQKSYAASDAYAGLRIYDCLQKERMRIDPIPQLPPCVKCNDTEKRKVVTPIADGGTVPVSSWNTAIPDITMPLQSSGSQDWASMVEDEVGTTTTTTITTTTISVQSTPQEPIVPITKAKKIRKKRENVNSAAAEKEKSPKAKEKPPLSADMEFATEWAESHKMWRQFGTSTAAPLKAYALWHVRNLDVEDVAEEMGIQPRTVASYITQAVKQDKLEYSSKRYHIVWSYLPKYGGRSGGHGFARDLDMASEFSDGDDSPGEDSQSDNETASIAA